MKWLQTVMIAVFITIGYNIFLGQTPGEIGLVGGFNGNGPWASWSGQWLALMERNGAFELRGLVVSSTRQSPGCGGVGSIAFNVVAPPAPSNTLLFRGFPAIKEGPVGTAFHGDKFLLPGEDLDVSLGSENPWWLVAFGTARPNQLGHPQFIDYQLRMTGPDAGPNRGRSATVFSLAVVNDDRPPKILWVGDLDADKIPDIIVEDITDHYNVNRHTLFLSSLARTGLLVVEVGSVSSTGC